MAILARSRRSSLPKFFFVLALLACASLLPAQNQPTLSRELREKIDHIALETLANTKVPSASVSIVKDGQIAYAQAYGDAKLDPRVAARSEMRYSIGSISKQFTAAAILMLAEQGKLTLDDPVSKFVPDLTRANEVTIRQLLSHTSGYQDYWPQDYVPPFMLHEITAEQILDQWARKPLDFDPGTKWQYSNTNYVIAGLIVEKASGQPILKFLSDHIFAPLGMKTVVNIDQDRLAQTDPTGYMRYALGPPRVAPKEGKGWLFAAGELAMPAPELAKWDISMLEQKLLKPASYKEMQTEVKLKNGQGTHYGLGIGVGETSGHLAYSHGGEVSGFVSSNAVIPDGKIAIVVLTNEDASSAASEISHKIAPLLLSENTGDLKTEQQDRKIFDGLQRGKIDRSLFTDNANFYFTEQALKDFADSLGPLGTPEEFTQASNSLRGGMKFRRYKVKFQKKTVAVTIFEMPDGKIEQYQVIAQD